MPIKGLEKGDGVWGSGKEPFLKRFFPLPQVHLSTFIGNKDNQFMEVKMNIFEAIMLICFGASWPVSIWKTFKVKNPVGKSVGFLWLIIIGYVAGIINKVLGKTDWVLALYILNTVMVSADLFLVIYYRKLRAAGKLS